jgi:hypothetical protein
MFAQASESRPPAEVPALSGEYFLQLEIVFHSLGSPSSVNVKSDYGGAVKQYACN